MYYTTNTFLNGLAKIHIYVPTRNIRYTCVKGILFILRYIHTYIHTYMGSLPGSVLRQVHLYTSNLKSRHTSIRIRTYIYIHHTIHIVASLTTSLITAVGIRLENCLADRSMLSKSFSVRCPVLAEIRTTCIHTHNTYGIVWISIDTNACIHTHAFVQLIYMTRPSV